jgi:glycosyltransferase involved in cell wall biosynthesis
MTPDKPLISVIIPHLNQPDSLEHCLDSLQSQTLERAAFEIIVVDNGSTSLPRATIERYPDTRLLQEARPGPGLARNRGVEAAKADILAFIDADCRAHTDWLVSALHALQTAPPRTILGGDVQIWRECKKTFTALEAYESVFAYRFKLYIEQHGFSGTGNLVVRKSDFEDIGPFRGIDVAEDIDFGQRARAAGYIFRYISEMVVFHPARQSLRDLWIKWDRHIQPAVNVGERTAIWRAKWGVRALAILVSPLIDWTSVVSSDRIRGTSARFKAIGVLLAVRSYRAYRMINLIFANKGVVWNRNSTILKTDIHNDMV